MIKTGLFSAHSHRGGYTLVFFAMLMFALMGLAALVIDIGFARLTQRQMQTAVDSAALEGLRFREDPIVPEGKRDSTRRQRASDLVAMIFDDDLDPGNGDDGAFYDAANLDPHEGEQFNVEGQFGAGPILEFTDGVNDNEPVGDTKLAASKFIHAESNPNPNPEVGSYRATPFYKPQLQLNEGNEQFGDMVSGSFDSENQNPFFNPPEGDTNPSVNEYSDTATGQYYVQRQFRSESDLPKADAFLVRLRRVSAERYLANVDDRVLVSSVGPEVPYIFGRGSLLAFRDPDTTYSPRHHGITVRATGIADARPVVRLGTSNASVVLAFAIRATDWKDLPPEQPSSLSLVTGQCGSIAAARFQVGETAELLQQTFSGSGYISIIHNIGGQDRVIGFGHAEVALESPTTLLVEKLVDGGGNGTMIVNGTAVLASVGETLESLSTVDRDGLLSAIFGDDSTNTPPILTDPLLAPVSVR